MPVPTGAESAAFDARAIDDLEVPAPVLMENAGRAAAMILQRLHPSGRVGVVAGSGNNGGDGLVLARSLTTWARQVELFLVGDRPEPDPLLRGWTLTTHADASDLTRRLAAFDIVVDALLGTGIRGAPREPQARAIQAMNQCGRPVVALDLPSGVDADTGRVPGEAVSAHVTVTFGAPKMGTLLHPGRERAGRLIAVEIGFPPWSEATGREGELSPPAASALLITPGWAEARRPRRPPVTHKNAAGRLLLLAGSEDFGGAAVLAARAALKGGVGYVRVAAPAGLGHLIQSSVPEAVYVDASDAEALASAVRASDAVAAGPGLGTGADARERLGTVLRSRETRPVVLDADALNLLARGEAAGWDPSHALLTPHPGEAGRLLDREAGAVAGDPVGAVRELAERFGAAVLLKGIPSLVAPLHTEEPLLVSASGSSDLARAGMGDTLTGAAGAFLARGAPPVVAGGLALHFTGRAAALADAGEALLPSDVSAHLPQALAEGGDGTTDLGLPFVVLDLPRLP